jgi:hypothetical protein
VRRRRAQLARRPCASLVPPQRSDRCSHRRLLRRILKCTGDGALAGIPRRGLLGQFQIPTIRVGKSHLFRCATIRFEHHQGDDQNTEALGAGSGDIESVQTVKKFHARAITGQSGSISRSSSHALLSKRNSTGTSPPTCARAHSPRREILSRPSRHVDGQGSASLKLTANLRFQRGTASSQNARVRQISGSLTPRRPVTATTEFS